MDGLLDVHVPKIFKVLDAQLSKVQKATLKAKKEKEKNLAELLYNKTLANTKPE